MKILYIFLPAALILAVMLVGCNTGGDEDKAWDTTNLVGDGNYSVPSPDGDKVAFNLVEDDTAGIWIYDFATRQPVRLYHGPHNSDYTWNPSSDTIAYSDPRGGIYSGIWKLDLNGGKTRLTDYGIYPDWSPDGSTIVFQNDAAGGISTVAASGGMPQILTTAGFHPLYSPDGNTIAYYDAAGTVYSLHTIDAGGGNPVVQTNGGPEFDWSPDGSELVFVSYETIPGTGGSYFVLRTMPLGGSSSLLWTGGTTPKWSPDGSRIIFEGISGDQVGGIFIIDPITGAADRVTDQGYFPSFLESADRIVFSYTNGIWYAERNR